MSKNNSKNKKMENIQSGQEKLRNYADSPEAQLQNQDHNSHKEALGPNTKR